MKRPDAFTRRVFEQRLQQTIIRKRVVVTIYIQNEVIWFIAGLYILTITWLVTEYVNMPKTGNGGYGFAIGMYSMIVPGALTLIAALAFIVTQATKKSG